jgi:hypothetical protein
MVMPCFFLSDTTNVLKHDLDICPQKCRKKLSVTQKRNISNVKAVCMCQTLYGVVLTRCCRLSQYRQLSEKALSTPTDLVTE